MGVNQMFYWFFFISFLFELVWFMQCRCTCILSICYPDIDHKESRAFFKGLYKNLRWFFLNPIDPLKSYDWLRNTLPKTQAVWGVGVKCAPKTKGKHVIGAPDSFVFFLQNCLVINQGYYLARCHQMCPSPSGGWHLCKWHMFTWLSGSLDWPLGQVHLGSHLVKWPCVRCTSANLHLVKSTLDGTYPNNIPDCL